MIYEWFHVGLNTRAKQNVIIYIYIHRCTCLCMHTCIHQYLWLKYASTDFELCVWYTGYETCYAVYMVYIRDRKGVGSIVINCNVLIFS